MTLILPDFSDPWLTELSVCALFESAEPLATEQRLLQVRMEVDEDAVWIRMCSESEDGIHGHLHVDVGRERVFSGHPRYDTVSVEDIQEVVATHFGQMVSLKPSAEFDVPRGLIPEQGMLNTLLGLSTETCGAQMTLDAAGMTISDSPFTRLRWDFDETDDTVHVDIYAATEVELSESYLLDAAEFMRDGIDCFVLESGEPNEQRDRQMQSRAQA